MKDNRFNCRAFAICGVSTNPASPDRFYYSKKTSNGLTGIIWMTYFFMSRKLAEKRLERVRQEIPLTADGYMIDWEINEFALVKM